MKETLMECNNQRCLVFTKNSKYNSKIKYIDILYNFIKKRIKIEVTYMKYQTTKDILIDLLKKGIKKRQTLYIEKIIKIKSL